MCRTPSGTRCPTRLCELELLVNSIAEPLICPRREPPRNGLPQCRSAGTPVGVSGTGHAGGWRRRTLPNALWNQCGKNGPATATKAKSFDVTLNAIVDGVDELETKGAKGIQPRGALLIVKPMSSPAAGVGITRRHRSGLPSSAAAATTPITNGTFASTSVPAVAVVSRNA